MILGRMAARASSQCATCVTRVTRVVNRERYRFHRYVSGDSALPTYAEWEAFIIKAKYTPYKAFVSYQKGIPWRVWRYVIFDLRFMWDVVRYAVSKLRDKWRAVALEVEDE